jgi:hypothetical protein
MSKSSKLTLIRPIDSASQVSELAPGVVCYPEVVSKWATIGDIRREC